MNGPNPRGGAISDVFDAQAAPLPRPRPRMAGALVAWIVLIALTAALGVLFQNPTR